MSGVRGVIDIVTRHAAAHLPSAGSAASTMQNLWSMGGAITEDFDEDPAAFSREGANWFWETVTLWDTADQDAGFHAWVDGVHAELKPHVRSNCYVNLSTDNGADGRRGVWGSTERYARLERAKADWDAQNLLRFNKNIEPAKAV
ncbi:BBE domain-containing protein [Streptomyces sp. MB09-02B]|uniref:BBE domain-containing protein n=1 Tax=Streptomyces sp. MB09-02B TaxID=3028667 RepID=UPI0029A1EAA7|nr:BBE domain-containing protein [Streptomyces sp. MB09-02B]MDX3640829.1 BBE domain-containing protein [Streptomyces sp. MB09-02B]